jgi:hypothetical protein
MVRKVDASLKEGREKGDKGASKTFYDKKWDAIAACYFEGVRLFVNT